jgi:hypothetical protein
VSATIRAIDQENDPGRPWLTLVEAGRLTGRHPDTLRTMIRRGRLEGRKGNSGGWLVRMPDRMLARNSDRADPEGRPVADPVHPVKDPVTGPGGDPVLVELRLELARAEVRLAEREAAAAKTEAVLRGTMAELQQALAKAEARGDRLEAALVEARRPLLLRLLDGLRRKG